MYIKDMNGNEISKGDLLNIFFTTGNGEYNHDCLYEATIGALGDIQFKFKDLMWECHGHNQYPIHTTLSQKYESLDYRFDGDGNLFLIVPDSYNRNHFSGKRRKSLDKSNYFVAIDKQPIA